MSGLREFMYRRDVTKMEHVAEAGNVPSDPAIAKANEDAWARQVAGAGLDHDEVAEVSWEMGTSMAMDVLDMAQSGALAPQALASVLAGAWLDGLIVGRMFDPASPSEEGR